MKKVLVVILAAALLLCAFPASAFAVTADVPEGALQYKIRITDNFGWGKAFLYAWDADGNDIFAAYPGKEIEAKGINEYGENYFEITLPHNTEGFIIDNGNDNRTVEIRDFKDYDGYWMDGTEDAYGHYYVTGYNDNPVDNTDPDGCTEPDYTYEIVITNSLDWEDFYVYAWTYSGEDIFGEWPGTKLFDTNLKNGYGHDVFVFYLPEDTYGFIVSNGKGEQSQDVTDLGEHDYYFTGEKDDFGNYYVDTPQCTCGLTEPTTAPKPDGYRYVVVTNNFGWEKLYVYTWDEKDQPIEAAGRVWSIRKSMLTTTARNCLYAKSPTTPRALSSTTVRVCSRRTFTILRVKASGFPIIRMNTVISNVTAFTTCRNIMR